MLAFHFSKFVRTHIFYYNRLRLRIVKIYVVIFMTVFISLFTGNVAAIGQFPAKATQTVLHDFMLPYLYDLGIHYKVSIVSQNCSAFNSGSAIVTCNRVMNCALPNGIDVSVVKEFFEDLPFIWITAVDDKETQAVLEENGINNGEVSAAMAVDLDCVDPFEYSDGIDVKRIDINGPDLEIWITVISQIFALQKCELLKAVHLIQEHTCSGVIQLYLGIYNGHPAAVGYMLQYGQIASLHWMGTLPEYRKKGLATAITGTILMDAKNMGASKAILLASSVGRSVYERLGFKEYGAYKVYGYGIN